MPIRSWLDEDFDLFNIAIEGTITYEMVSAFVELLRLEGRTGRHDTIVEVASDTASAISYEQVQSLARHLPVNPMIVAFVSGRTDLFGVLRMYEAVSELKSGTGPRGVFHTREEALIWIETERVKRLAETLDSAKTNEPDQPERPS